MLRALIDRAGADGSGFGLPPQALVELGYEGLTEEEQFTFNDLVKKIRTCVFRKKFFVNVCVYILF